VFASKSFRTAVPDLHLEVEEMLMVGDRVIGRLRFTGHFRHPNQSWVGVNNLNIGVPTRGQNAAHPRGRFAWNGNAEPLHVALGWLPKAASEIRLAGKSESKVNNSKRPTRLVWRTIQGS
jgi:SnoaL-like polyketide cyclase